MILPLAAALSVSSVPPATAGHIYIDDLVDGSVTAAWDSQAQQVAVEWSNDDVEGRTSYITDLDIHYSTVVYQGVVDTYGDHGGSGSYVEVQDVDSGISSLATSKTFTPGRYGSQLPSQFYVQVQWACSQGAASCGSDETHFASEAVLVETSGSRPSPTPTRSATPTSSPTPTPTSTANSKPRVSIADAYVFEGETERILQYRVSLNGTATQQVTVGVTLSLAQSTAESAGGPNQDFTITPGNVTLGPGVGPGGSYLSSRFFTVTVLGDGRDEPDEMVVLTLNNPVNATIARGAATGTIYDNDDPQVVSGSEVAAVEGTGVTITHAPRTLACPGTAPCTVIATGGARIAPGDRVSSGASPARVTTSEGSILVLNANSSIVWSGPSLFKQPRGTTWYSLAPRLTGSWVVSSRNARTRVRGTEFTVGTTKKRDAIFTYDGAVSATGRKGKAVVIKEARFSTCVARRACARPRPFELTAELLNEMFWNQHICRAGTSCLLDGDDSTGPLDISEVTITRSTAQVRVEIRTYEPWDSKLLEFNWPYGTLSVWFYEGFGSPVYYVRPEYRDRKLKAWVGTNSYGTDPATIERPDQNSVVVTFDRAGLDASGANVWKAHSSISHSSEAGRYQTEWSCTGENPVASGRDVCTDFAPEYPGTHDL